MNYVKLAAALALLAAIVWGALADYSAGKKAGSSAIQVLWDADKAAIAKETATAIATATKERDDALQANEAIHSDYETQLSASRALGDSLAQRLRDAYTHPTAGSGAVPKAGDRQGTVATGPQSGDVPLTSALSDALTECSANAAQLDALIVELKPQL